MITKAKQFLWAILGAVLLLAGAALAGPLSAAADTVVSGANASLVLPASYEQYLALNSPVDVAFSENYLAVADGSDLYVYDRAARRYDRTALPAGRTVSKIGFSEGERLFLADTGGGNYFYEYNFPTRSLERLNINCSTFCIDGQTLYTATVSTGSPTVVSYDLADLREEFPVYRDLGRIDNAHNATPSMTVIDGMLYCAIEDRVYYPDAASGSFEAGGSFYLSDNPNFASGVKSVCAHDGALYYTAEGGLYRSDLAAHTSTRVLEGSGFGAAVSYRSDLYCIKKRSVVEIRTEGDTAYYTGYEIAASSPSEWRLSGAVDLARAGDILVTADAGNQRISVAALRQGEHGKELSDISVIRCLAEDGMPYTPALVATDGDLIAVSSGNYIYLYHVGDTTYFYRQTLDDPATGLVCVYGACYYVTEFSYGRAEMGYAPFTRSQNAPKALAADLYGTLYVVNASGEVQAYTEEQFIDSQVERGTPVDVTLPARFTHLSADFEGNLYCLSESALLKNGEPLLTFSSVAQDLRFVYGGADMPLAYALGFEDNELFLLYGDYLVKTERDLLGIPTLDRISAEGVHEEVFRAHDENGLLVDVPKGTIGIRTDLAALRESDPAYFPYDAYYRTDEDRRGILLAQTGRYSLVILYEVRENTRYFTANLFRLDGNTVPAEEYWTPEETPYYLSSDVSLYYFPCLHAALAGERISRGTRLDVLGYVEAPERSYALVRTQTRTESFLGFVPRSFLTEAAPDPVDLGYYEPAWLKATEEGVLFTADSGETMLVTERTRAEFVDNRDGTFEAYIMKDGTLYHATVEGSLIDRGENDALRISLIIILTVLAVGIVGAYCYLLPRKNALGSYET